MRVHVPETSCTNLQIIFVFRFINNICSYFFFYSIKILSLNAFDMTTTVMSTAGTVLLIVCESLVFLMFQEFFLYSALLSINGLKGTVIRIAMR